MELVEVELLVEILFAEFGKLVVVLSESQW